MDANTPERHIGDAERGRARWTAPTLTVLGSLASTTMAQTVSLADLGGSGTIAGDSGTIV